LHRQHDQAVIDAADERVLALKVFDRLHNMRTLRHLDQDKQRRKSQHTLDLIAPLARRLGLQDVSDELETIARDHLTLLSGNTGAAYQALALSALLLPATARRRYLDEWLGELDVLSGSPARARFMLRLTLGMPVLAFILRRPPQDALICRLLTALRWLLRTDLRTWTPLTILIGWMIIKTAPTGIVNAALTLITVPPVLHTGVTFLRAKLGIGEPDEPSS